jgi:hypothetical protein
MIIEKFFEDNDLDMVSYRILTLNSNYPQFLIEATLDAGWLEFEDEIYKSSMQFKLKKELEKYNLFGNVFFHYKTEYEKSKIIGKLIYEPSLFINDDGSIEHYCSKFDTDIIIPEVDYIFIKDLNSKKENHIIMAIRLREFNFIFAPKYEWLKIGNTYQEIKNISVCHQLKKSIIAIVLNS